MATVWTTPAYTTQQINKAGRLLSRDKEMEWLELEKALVVINNHRSSHSYPLNTFQVTLRNYARSLDKDALIAQRIKRLASIDAKLRRFPTMRLSQVQDIGGCRAVVATIGHVRQLNTLYEVSQIKHQRLNVDNYITSPQPSGYRGIHLVYKYLSDKNQHYNGLKLEIQLRSRYQHAWATAVETVGTFVRQALKSSLGEAEWLRFFALMGTAVAMRERSMPVPNTPTSREELVAELGYFAAQLNVSNRLQAYNTALRTLQDDQAKTGRDSHYFLLELDPSANQLLVSGFKRSELPEASEQYLAAERRVKDAPPGRDAVLVSVESLSTLQRAYPNYFADTRVFLSLLDQTLKNAPSRISS